MKEAVSAEPAGTKAAAHYRTGPRRGRNCEYPAAAHESRIQSPACCAFCDLRRSIFAARRREADDFYATIIPRDLSPDAQNVMRQAFAGLLWSKQFYHYVVQQWLKGDPGHPPPPAERTARAQS